MEIFDEVRTNNLRLIKDSGLHKTIEDFANLLEYISGRIFAMPKFESYEKNKLLKCYGIDASVLSLKGIIELCSIGDIVDAVMLIRKIRDNLFLDLFLIKSSDEWDESDMSLPDLKDLVSNPDSLVKLLNEFTTKQIKYEIENKYKEAIKKWREGKLANNAERHTKREYFQFSKYLEYLKSDNCFQVCYEKHLKSQFDYLDSFLNDFTHSNSPSNLNNYLIDEKFLERLREIEKAIRTLKVMFVISMYFVDSRYFQTEDYENCIEFTHDDPEGLQYNVISDIVDLFEDLKNRDESLYYYLVKNNKYSMKIRIEDY